MELPGEAESAAAAAAAATTAVIDAGTGADGSVLVVGMRDDSGFGELEGLADTR